MSKSIPYDTCIFYCSICTRLDMSKSIGKRVKEAREARDISQQQLAELIHKSQALICQIEQGKRKPGLHTAIQLSNVLGIKLEDLIED